MKKKLLLQLLITITCPIWCLPYMTYLSLKDILQAIWFEVGDFLEDKNVS
jgi:hypothetical protein